MAIYFADDYRMTEEGLRAHYSAAAKKAAISRKIGRDARLAAEHGAYAERWMTGPLPTQVMGSTRHEEILEYVSDCAYRCARQAARYGLAAIGRV